MSVKAAAIIPAAGSGRRMKTDIPKQFLELAGKPVLVHTVSTFAQCSFIENIIVVVGEDRVASTMQMLTRFLPESSKIKVVAGGRRRQDSVKNGLDEVAGDSEVILVHDGARPLVSEDLIKRCYTGIGKHGAVIAAVPVKDTLKKEDGNRTVFSTVDRTRLWRAQTPQGAKKQLLEKAYRLNGDDDVTDESSLLEKAAIPVHIVAGEESNLKITRTEDFTLAESIISRKTGSIRIGHGFDAHRFAENRKLILGGVEIDHNRGLAGHSDADVVCHALCDALLGAIGTGDIGRHFPDNDDRYKGISSLVLLDQVVGQCISRGMILGNTDITIVCQAPKLASYLELMRNRLAEHCLVASKRINIKATTTEKMGYTGREEGIGCHAVVLLEQR